MLKFCIFGDTQPVILSVLVREHMAVCCNYTFSLLHPDEYVVLWTDTVSKTTANDCVNDQSMEV